MVTIKTDNKWRDLVYRRDVPVKVLVNEFGHQNFDEASDGFFCYRGNWYHLDDFMRLDAPELGSWHGCATNSYFSGIVIQLSADGEQIKVGRYFS